MRTSEEIASLAGEYMTFDEEKLADVLRTPASIGELCQDIRDLAASALSQHQDDRNDRAD